MPTPCMLLWNTLRGMMRPWKIRLTVVTGGKADMKPLTMRWAGWFRLACWHDGMKAMLLFTAIIIAIPCCQAASPHTQLELQQQHVLRQLKVGCDPAPPAPIPSWDLNTSLATWPGITINQASGQVVAINLPSGWGLGSDSHQPQQAAAPPTMCHMVVPPEWSALTALTSLIIYREGSPFVHDKVTLPSAWSTLQQLHHLHITFTIQQPEDYADYQQDVYGVVPRPWSTLTALTHLQLQGLSVDEWTPAAWQRFTRLVHLSLRCGTPQCSSIPFEGEGKPFPVVYGQLTTLTHLDLGYNGYGGTIPVEWGSSLKHLQHLDLSENFYLIFQSPASLSQVTSLTHLALSDTQFYTPLPAAWSRLINLRHLDLSSVGIEGKLPSEWQSLTGLTLLNLPYFILEPGGVPTSWAKLTNLQVLNVSNCRMSGPLPAEWSSMKALRVLDLEGAGFTGTLPASWSELRVLEVLPMSRGSYDATVRLEGSIPSCWSTLTALKHLELPSNSLKGSIPSSWSTLTALTYLDFSSNLLTGSIPTVWGTGMTSLVVMNLVANSLTGPLPKSFSSLLKLQSLDVSSNTLNGPLPPEWLTLTALKDLAVDSNKLTGTLPVSWSSMTSLTLLGYSSNALHGPLPSAWATMKRLLGMSASNNALTGLLLPSWSRMTSLQYLQISQNALEGPAPPQWSTLTALTSLDLSSNSLTGPFPSTWTTMKQLARLALDSNNLVGAALPEDWDLTQLQDLLIGGGGNSIQLPPNSSWIPRLKSLSSLSLSGPQPAFSSVDALLQLMDAERLLSLSLSNVLNFKGTPLPAQSFANSTSLTSLIFNNNSHTGRLPVEWSTLPEMLYSISLQDNQLTGPIPTQWAQLKLFVLDVRHNLLTGTIPADLQQRVYSYQLYLQGNRFTGTLPIFKVCGMESLFVGGNILSGTLPSEWQQCPNLLYLDVSSNQLEGPIPAAWFNKRDRDPSLWASLVYLDMSSNRLEGTLPPLPPPAQYANMSNNQFTGRLQGVPDTLRYLHLGSNALTGSLPPILNTSALEYINLDNNHFTALPAVVAAPRAVFVSAVNNSLTGPLPDWFGTGSSDGGTSKDRLIFCDLSSNSLSGPIPASWAHHSWQYLSLAANRLAGSLPQVWAGNSSVVLLQDNSITGCLPCGWAHAQYLTVLTLTNNSLTCSKPQHSRTQVNGTNFTSCTYSRTGWPQLWVNLRETFPSLRLLALDTNSFAASVTIPRDWLQQVDHHTHNTPSRPASQNQSVLQLPTKLWRQSAQRSTSWTKAVCIDPQLNQDTAQVMKAQVSQEVYTALQTRLSAGLASLTLTLKQLNITAQFDAPPVLLYGITGLNINATSSFIKSICSNQGAVVIVAVQWSVVVGVVGLMLGVYWAATSGLLSVCMGKLCCLKSGKHKSRSRLGLVWRERLNWVTKLARKYGSAVKFLTSLVLYWLDIALDIVLLIQVWGRWPGYALLAVFVFHYLLTSAVLVVRLSQQSGQVLTGVAVMALLPVLPLLDSAITLMLAFQDMAWFRQIGMEGNLRSLALDWQHLFDMRDVLEVTFEALPTSILQSIVFVLGNRPSIGWFLSTRLYLASAVSSSFQIVRVTGMVLYRAHHHGVPPWRVLWAYASYSHTLVSGSLLGPSAQPGATTMEDVPSVVIDSQKMEGGTDHATMLTAHVPSHHADRPLHKPPS